MTIPDSVLGTWTSYETAATESAKTTHERIRNELEGNPNLQDLDFSTFLQGSYANTTLIRGSGDVDIVVKLNQTWMSDVSRLSQEQKRGYVEATEPASYPWHQFREDVVRVLESKYGSSTVTLGEKAIEVDADSLPLGADVVVASEFRRYSSAGDYIEGIVFWTDSQHNRIVNFPKHHIQNGAEKQKRTDGRFKETVRIFKNARTELVDRDRIVKQDAPSYFIECLLYNVPSNQYTNDLQNRFKNIVQYLSEANLENFSCQNELLPLFGQQSTQWSVDDASDFITQLQWLYGNYD